MFGGRSIIITGGSSGLGRALARRLAARGANLALIARDEGRLRATREELHPLMTPSQKTLTYSCDVSDYAAVERTMAAIAAALGTPHILINSAGILREGYFEKVPMQVFREVMDINYFGTLHCVKAVLPYFQRSGEGWVVNVSSIAGRVGVFGYSAYCPSKYAVLGLTESLRCELKPQHIRLQVVCPPEFSSPMVEELNKDRTPENIRHAHTMPVLGVEEVADAVMDGMENGRYLIIPGRISHVLDTASRLLPPLSRLIVDMQIRRAYRGPQ